jgi:beta-phosphoglucomutase-like phosphatase (HAD superfamily)
VFGDWRPRAVVFDCDGLLVDTESCWTTAEAQLCAARGVTLSGQDAAALIGASVPDACRRLCDGLGDGCTPAQVQDELVARVVSIIDRDARAMDGAPELVALVTARLPAAVASNSPRALLDHALRRGGLSAALTVSVAADEVARPKSIARARRLPRRVRTAQGRSRRRARAGGFGDRDPRRRRRRAADGRSAEPRRSGDRR